MGAQRVCPTDSDRWYTFLVSLNKYVGWIAAWLTGVSVGASFTVWVWWDALIRVSV